MRRAERAAEAAELRAQGLLYREIAERMGISVSYAQDLVNDPDGSALRARKDTYRGTCKDCGAPTDGSNGRVGAPVRCIECWARDAHETSVAWLVAEIRHWADLYGRPPSAVDWNIATMRRRNLRYDRGDDVGGRFSDVRIAEAERRHREDGPWPAQKTVTHTFGSWNAAIEAAGFEPLVPGGRRDPEEWHRRRYGKAAA